MPSPYSSAAPNSPSAIEHRAASALAARVLGHQRHQREDAAFALVVRAHDEDQVLDRNQQRERPEDQRQDAEDVLARGRDAVRAVKTLTQRVQRTGADVAVDDAEGTERQKGQVTATRRRSVCWRD